jgi:hypothetical protein
MTIPSALVDRPLDHPTHQETLKVEIHRTNHPVEDLLLDLPAGARFLPHLRRHLLIRHRYHPLTLHRSSLRFQPLR